MKLLMSCHACNSNSNIYLFFPQVVACLAPFSALLVGFSWSKKLLPLENRTVHSKTVPYSFFVPGKQIVRTTQSSATHSGVKLHQTYTNCASITIVYALCQNGACHWRANRPTEISIRCTTIMGLCGSHEWQCGKFCVFKCTIEASNNVTHLLKAL